MTEETQPTGASVEQTLAVVSHILVDPEFAAEVRNQNGWVEDMTDRHDTAILFLASRYQWSVGLLSMQTNTLSNQVQGLERRIVDLEDRRANGS